MGNPVQNETGGHAARVSCHCPGPAAPINRRVLPAHSPSMTSVHCPRKATRGIRRAATVWVCHPPARYLENLPSRSYMRWHSDLTGAVMCGRITALRIPIFRFDGGYEPCNGFAAFEGCNNSLRLFPPSAVISTRNGRFTAEIVFECEFSGLLCLLQ